MSTQNVYMVYMNLLRNQIRDLAEQNRQRANEIKELTEIVNQHTEIFKGMVGD